MATILLENVLSFKKSFYSNLTKLASQQAKALLKCPVPVCESKHLAAVSASALLLIGVGAYSRHCSVAISRELDVLAIVDNFEDCLAVECIDNHTDPTQIHETDCAKMVTFGDIAVVVDGVPRNVDDVVSKTPDVYSIDLERVNVRDHRRLKSGARGKYLKTVLNEVKCKFGTPKSTEANYKSVRRFAENIMVRHGLRPNERKRVIDMVVNLAFVPNQDEIRACRTHALSFSLMRKMEYNLSSIFKRE